MLEYYSGHRNVLFRLAYIDSLTGHGLQLLSSEIHPVFTVRPLPMSFSPAIDGALWRYQSRSLSWRHGSLLKRDFDTRFPRDLQTFLNLHSSLENFHLPYSLSLTLTLQSDECPSFPQPPPHFLSQEFPLVKPLYI